MIPESQVQQPEDENQRPTKISRLTSYNELFRPSLEAKPPLQSIVKNVPGFEVNNGLSMNIQPIEQALSYVDNGSDQSPTRNGSVVKSIEGSTREAPSQPPPTPESSNTPTTQPRVLSLKSPPKTCCKKPKKQASKSSPKKLKDRKSNAHAFSSASNIETGISSNQVDNLTETPSFLGDMEGQVASPFQAQFTFQTPQVPYMTLYNMPPGYETASNPLASEQQFILQDPQLQSHTVPQYACNDLIGSTAPSAEMNNAFSLMLDCQCGPGCQCLYCADHPYNATTRERVETLVNLLPPDDADHSPRSRPQSSYGSNISPTSEFSGSVPGVNDLQFHENPLMSSTMQPMTLVQPGLGSNGFQAVPFENLDRAQNSAVLSSEYFTMAYTYAPGPFEECKSGKCRCGDDCPCVGCLTHTGHDGQVLSG